MAYTMPNYYDDDVITHYDLQGTPISVRPSRWLQRVSNEIPYRFRGATKEKNDFPESELIRIPKESARSGKPNNMSTDEIYTDKDSSKYYEFLLIMEQSHSFANENTPVLILYRTPITNTLISIYVYHNRRIEIERKDHTIFLRETDEIDRRIIKGFIYKNCSWICRLDIWNIKSNAASFKIDNAPKRVVTSLRRFNETFDIFSNVSFI